MWWALLFEGILIIWLSVTQLSRLASKTVPWHVRLSVLSSYMLSLSVVALVPLDVHLVYVRRCLQREEEFQDSEDVEFRCNMSWWGHWRLLYPGNSLSPPFRPTLSLRPCHCPLLCR